MQQLVKKARNRNIFLSDAVRNRFLSALTCWRDGPNAFCTVALKTLQHRIFHRDSNDFRQIDFVKWTMVILVFH